MVDLLGALDVLEQGAAGVKGTKKDVSLSAQKRLKAVGQTVEKEDVDRGDLVLESSPKENEPSPVKKRWLEKMDGIF